MKRLLTFLTALFLLVSLNGQIMRYSNYTAPSGGGAPSFLSTDGHTPAWYMADDADDVIKDGSNLVSEWSDHLGSTHDLLQATGTNQPTWSSTGIAFDGADNFMKTATYTLNQPLQIYMVLKINDYNDGEDVFAGYSGNPILRTANAGTLNANANGDFASATGPTQGEWGIICVRFDHSTTGHSVTVNNVEGDIITGAGAGEADPAGLTIGANATPTGTELNVEFQEIIIRDQVDSEANALAIYNYLATKYAADL